MSCQDNSSIFKYYPSAIDYSEIDVEIINLDSTQLNFKQIVSKVGNSDYGSRTVVVEVSEENVIKRFIPFTYSDALYKNRNVLRIKSDSILKLGGYPISELDTILRKHYFNNGSNSNYSDSPDKAIVEINLDSTTEAHAIKKTLISVSNSFDKLKLTAKDSIVLRVFLSYSRPAEIPPMPIMVD